MITINFISSIDDNDEEREYRCAAHRICNSEYSAPKKIPIVFHNRSNYDYHFLIKKLAEEFKKHFTCLGENTEKYVTFTVLIKKEVTRIDKNGQEITKNISYIDSARFIASSLSNLVSTFSQGIHRIKCKFAHDDMKCETCGNKYKYCDSFLKYANFKDDLIEYKLLSCNKSYQQKFGEKSKESFLNTCKFSKHHKNKFIFSLRKGIYPYEYMDNWEKFNEALLPEKEDFYSHFNMEHITDADCAHAKRVCKDFEIKNLGIYHDFHVQSNTLLLADVFGNFRNMCLEIYKVDPAKLLLALGLAWQAALKKTKVRLDLLTNIDMLLIVKEGIKGGICRSIYRYAKANNKYMKDYDKNKDSSYLQNWDVKTLCGWEISQKLLVNNFDCEKDTFQFNENFIKNCNEESDEGYFPKVNAQCL